VREIELYTGKDLAFVARVLIPPFPDQNMPDVVMWGNRIFKLLGGIKGPYYVECFAVVALELANNQDVPSPP
jgi:hypothetical protein